MGPAPDSVPTPSAASWGAAIIGVLETTLESLGVSVLFVLCVVVVAFAWDYLFFAFIKFTGLQKWKDEAKLHLLLDIYDRIMYNTLGHPREFGSSPEGGGSIFAEPLNHNKAEHFPNRAGGNHGPDVEYSVIPRVSVVSRSGGGGNGVSPAGDGSDEDSVWPENEIDYDHVAMLYKKRKKCRLADMLGCSTALGYLGFNKVWKKEKLWLNGTSQIEMYGHSWEPKVKKRTTLKYLRGNFLTLVGRLVTVLIVLLGALAMFRLFQVDWGSALSGGGLFAIATVLGLSTYLSPVISYFMLLFFDTVNRGDVIVISTSLSGVCSSPAYSDSCMLGVVQEISPRDVKLLCTMQYKNNLTASGTGAVTHDKVLGPSGNMTDMSSLLSHLTNGMYGGSGDGSVNNNTTQGIGANMTFQQQSAMYIQRDFVKVRGTVSIPTTLFSGALTYSPISWKPTTALLALKVD